MIRILELFAGIGACSKALENLGIEHEIVDAVEIDKYAIQAFNAIHGTNFEPQDICKWDKDIECDLIMHGSPCQDFSIAGKQAGGDKNSGTRSSLMYETLRIVEKLKPKYVIWENVKNILSEKHRHNFEAYCHEMAVLGYSNYAQVLNAKDYGVPQNRERVFTVSILGDGKYKLLEPIPLEKRLKDVLEENVDEKYYLSDEQVASFVASTKKAEAKGNGFKFEPFERERERGIAHTIATRAGSRQTDNFIKELSAESRRSMTSTSTNAFMEQTDWRQQSVQGTTAQRFCLPVKTANRKGFDMAIDGDGVDLAYPNSKTRRGRVGHEVSKTLPTSDSQGVLDGFRIRKLTPRECYRLMGFDDASFDRASAVLSNTQLYKTAGNSIVVNVLEAILKELLCN